MLERYPAQTLENGDVLITNDPWLCAGHLFDLAIVTPVFREGRVIGFAASVAHCSDIGGIRDSMAAREIYDEGIQIPPSKLHRAGTPNEDLLALVAANVRVSDLVLGDMQAQVTANRVGARRLLEIMDEYELEDLIEVGREIQGRSEAAMRAAIDAVPDGEYRHAVTCDAAGEPLTLPVRVTVEGDEVHVDWEGAPPQVAQGAVNCTLSYVRAHCMYALKCVLTPDTPSNAGCFRPIHVTAPVDSVLNCTYPAAVNMRTMVGWYGAPALMGALAEAMPDRVQAFTALPMWVFAYGRDGDRVTFSDHLAAAGGQGASSAADGQSAILYPTSAANTAVELFEARTPLVVEYKELVPDSAGAGRHRGGLGVASRCESSTTTISRYSSVSRQTDAWRWCRRARSRRSRGGVSVTLEDGTVRTSDWALNGLVELRTTGQRLVFELGGGSGYGPATERPLDDVARDLAYGYITRAGLADYGCERLDGTIARHPSGP